MNLTLKLTSAACALLAIGARQDSVTLRRQLTEGQTDRYTMTMVSKELVTSPLGLGDQEITTDSSMKLTLLTGKVDEAAHKAALTMTASDIRFVVKASMIGEMPNQNIPKEIVSRGFLDDHNRILEMKLPPGLATQPGSYGATDLNGFLFVEFPDAPVKANDKWTVTFPKSPMFGDRKLKMEATLVGAGQWNGQDAWELKARGDVPLNIDLNKLMKGQKDPTGGAFGNMKMILTGSINVSIDALVDKTTGRGFKMVVKTKGKQHIEIVDRGMKIPMTSDGTMTMELQR